MATLLGVDSNARSVTYRRLTGITGDAVEPLLFGGPAPGDRYDAAAPLSDWGHHFARSLGRVLAAFHGVEPVDGARMLPPVDWPLVRERLRAAGFGSAAGAIETLEGWERTLESPVMTHGDPHFHNLFVGDDGEILGLVDFDETGLAPRELDLMFVHSEGPRFAEAVISAYESASGLPVDRDEAFRFHLRAAADHIAFHPPDHERLPGMLDWFVHAVRAAPEGVFR